MFLGRKYEFEQLDTIAGLKKSSLVVCKGRRRIGKSSLIAEFGKRAGCFIELQGLPPRENLSNEDQLDYFARQLSLRFRCPKNRFEDWTEAFACLDSHLSQLKTSKKIVLLIDEISWLGAEDPDFSGKLKVAWDMRLKKHQNLITVLCGSVSSWIEENILNNTDFLGRISLVLTLQELPLKDCVKFWGGKANRVSAYEKLTVLGVTGGVPRYLEEIHYDKSALWNIQNLCFKPDAILLDEFERIFNDIFEKRAKLYKEIVLKLADGHKEFLELCEAMKREKSGVILKYLQDLERSGFISRDHAYRPGKRKTKFNRFRISDNYLRFYLKYLLPNREKIQKGIYRLSGIEDLTHWNVIAGLQFENLILNNLDKVIEILRIRPSTIISASPYFQKKNSKNKGACQIDILIETRHNTLYVVELKFRKKIGSEVIREVGNKMGLLDRPKHYSIRPVLVYEGELDDSVAQEGFFDGIIKAEEFFT